MPSLLTRGCAPHGFVRDNRTVRGAAQPNARRVNGELRSNPLVTTGGILITGTFARRLVRVKTHCSRDRSEFKRFCRLHGITATIPHNVAGDRGYQTEYEVVGSPDALELLESQSYVVCYGDALDVRPPRDRFALSDGNNKKAAAPTVVRIPATGEAFVISCKGVMRVRS